MSPLVVANIFDIPLVFAAIVPWADIFKVFGVLVLFTPLVYLATKMYGRRSGFGGQGRVMRILESISVGPGKSLCLVAVPGERILVLGVTAQHIRLLTELDDPKIVAEMKAHYQNGETKEGFASILQRFGGSANFQQGEYPDEGRKE